MADFNTLYEQLKASAQSAAKSANTLVTMMTADENTDVGIDGFGLKPSFSKQLKTWTQPLIDQMSAFLDQSVATFDQFLVTSVATFDQSLVTSVATFDHFLVTSDARVTQFLQNSGYQVIGDYTDGPYTIGNYNSVVKYDGSLYKLKSDTDVPFTTTGTTASSWANDSSHFYAIDGDMLSQQLASDLPGNGSSLIGDEVDGTVKDALVRSRLNTREIWRRSLAEAGLTLVDGSFEEGATVNSKEDAVWHIAEGQCYSWDGYLPKHVFAGEDPTLNASWAPRASETLRGHLGIVSVKMFGAKGDGVTDDGPAIRSAIAYCKAMGSGTLYFPAGVYLVGRGNPFNAFYALTVDFSDFRIKGDSLWNTSIKVADGANVGPVNLAGAVGFEIDNITLDGNAATQGGAGLHGLAASDADYVVGTNLRIRNTVGYGIGFQGTTITDFKYVKFDGLYLEDIGSDGTDFKNKALTNAGLILNNVYIKGVGRVDAGKKAGLDIRGPATVSNVHAYAGGNPITAIRFRSDEILGGPTNPDGGNGRGGRNSTLTNFYIHLENQGTSDGVVLDNENVSVSNGVVLGVPTGGTGIFNTSAGNYARLANVSAAAEGAAILFELAGSDVVVTNCIALSAIGLASVGFRYNGDRVSLSNCKSFYGQYGFRRSAGTLPNTLTNCEAFGATTSDYSTSVADIPLNCQFQTTSFPSTFISAGGLRVAEFAYVASAVNYPRFDPSATGSPVVIRPVGTDTSIDLQLASKGSTGRIRFGTLVANADAPISGYIEIRDTGGTIRKLAVIT